jgi:hypothetical protein
MDSPASTPFDFDLSAAWMRRAQADGSQFLEVLAARLEAALPDRVAVSRRRDGLFSRTSHVERLTVRMDAGVYDLAREGASLVASLSRVVRGIAISSKRLPLGEWAAALDAEMRALAAQAGEARSALHDLLAS